MRVRFFCIHRVPQPRDFVLQTDEQRALLILKRPVKFDRLVAIDARTNVCLAQAFICVTYHQVNENTAKPMVVRCKRSGAAQAY